MADADAIVIGAGPAGLATAAALRARGLSAVVLEQGPAVGGTWRRHYDRLRLHTVRWLSGLPGLPIPRRAGAWVPRDAFIAYLEDYARHHRLQLELGVEARRVLHAGTGWQVETDRGALCAPTVVVATGGSRVPWLPAWPGREGYAGLLLHSSAYRTGAAFRGRDVLVVGAGNSGAEIAVDLVEQGAARVRLSVRTAPNLVRRTVAGLIPAQLVALALARLPLPVADAIAGATARLMVGDLARLGLPRPERGLYSRLRHDRHVPIIDAGLIAALEAGRVEVVPRVEALEGAAVRLGDGRLVTPDVVVAATGYQPGLGALLGHLGVLDAEGTPRAHGPVPAAPGLHCIGFTVPPAGQLRQIALEAPRIAARARRAARQATRA